MDNEQSKLYRNSQWKTCRERIMQRDNFKCCRCGRSYAEVELQVHHINYYPSKRPWEYPDVELITLCKGCHAQEHGKIMPQFGWEYCGESDLEDLIGVCELCGNQIRYEHLVHHPNWGWLNVGCLCADRLIGDNTASDIEKKRKAEADRFKTFRNSPRWKHKGNRYYRNFEDYTITIWDNKTSFRIDTQFIYLNTTGCKIKKSLRSYKKYQTLEEAKYQVYYAITSGALKKHIEKKYGYLYLRKEESV